MELDLTNYSSNALLQSHSRDYNGGECVGKILNIARPSETFFLMRTINGPPYKSTASGHLVNLRLS